MARRSASYQQLLMDSMDAAQRGFGAAGENLMKQKQLGIENARADAESKARLGLIAEQTAGAKTENQGKTLDYQKALDEENLRGALGTAAKARDTALTGTATPDGHAVDFQAVKKGNRGFEQADANLWNSLHPEMPMGADQLVAKRARDQAGEELAASEKEAGATRAAEKHSSEMANDTASRVETVARTKLLGAQAEKAAAEAKNGGKTITADERKVATFGRRVEQSLGEMDRLAKGGYDRSSAKAGSGQMLPNVLKSSEAQQQSQAERNFVNAVLRRESGAAISPSEFESAEKQYFPRTGDSKETLDQKARNRQQILEGFKAESGSAWDLVSPVAVPSANDPRIKAALDAGYTQAEIDDYLKGKNAAP